LYEVDEAATRIREEVDQDANIIVGATFDESLEGIIRVAVVATGIDQVAAAAASGRAAPETRLAEIAHKLRADQQRIAERLERAETARAAAPAASPAGVESAARAAVAAAVLPTGSIEDVTIRPLQTKPTLFPEPAASEPPAPESVLPRAFIPPPPERPARPRMPRIDELPVPAQNELRAQLGETPPAEHPEKRRMGLLERLATVGLGRSRESASEGAEAPEAPVSRPPVRPRPADRAPPRPAPRAPEVRGGDPVSDYARRPAHQGLDPQGRPPPVHNSAEEDHLDIPAFLRRQVN
jgi:cell division protein FtsZ